MATEARRARATQRAEYVMALWEEGFPLRRAAYYAGVSDRTARRYVCRLRRQGLAA